MPKSPKFHNLTSVLLLLLLVVSTLSVGYFLSQLPQPSSPSAGFLAAEKGYGVTIDLTKYDDEILKQTLEDLHDSGLIWLRQPIHWAEIEPEPGQFNWQPLDRITTALSNFNQTIPHSLHPPNHPPIQPSNPLTNQLTIQPTNQLTTLPSLQLIPILYTTPRWARAPHTLSTAPPIAPSDFGRFAQAFAARYGHQIDIYQIWDEPNLSANWGHTFVDASAYAALLREGALNLRTVDPEAIIMAAALAPTLENGPLNLNEIDYLDQLYQANAQRWFDIVAAQPYGFDHEPSSSASPDVLNFRRVELLRQVMLRHGDVDTPIWATAFGWNALPSDWLGPKSPWKTGPSELQAQRTAEAIDLARQNWPWFGSMIAIRWDSRDLEQDDPARGFALRDTPPMLAALQAAATDPIIATPGNYPATHASGQYSSGWRLANMQTDIPRHQPRTLTIPFKGTHFDLVVNRGDFRGYLWVTIDGQPANALPQDSQGRSYVVLYDPLREAATVTLAQNLPPGRHQAEIIAEGGWGQWAIAGWSVYNQKASTFAQVGLIVAGILVVLSGTALGLRSARNFGSWFKSLRIRACKPALVITQLDERFLFAVTAALAVGLYFGTHDFALILLIPLALCLLLRPDFGLILIAFSLSFLPNHKSVPLLNISLLETVLLFSTIGLTWSITTSQWSTVNEQRPIINYQLSIINFTFLGLGLMATFFAYNFGVSMFAWRTMVLGPVVFCWLLLLIVAQPQSTNSTNLTWRLVDSFVLGAVFHAFLALYLFFFDNQFVVAEGVRRLVGPIYPTPNNLALFLERTWPILLAVALLPGQSRLRRGLYGLGGLMVTIAIYLTFSRATLLLALPSGLVGMVLVAGFSRHQWRRGLIVIGLGLAMLMIALLPLMSTPRLATIIDFSQGTTFFRLKLWQSALMMLRDHWLTGVGLDNFLYQYRTVYILPEAWQEPNLSHPHNLILDFGTSLGLGGIVILFGLQFHFWRVAWCTYQRSPTPLLLGLMGSMIVILSHGLVDHTYFLVDLAFAFFFIFGMVQRFHFDDDKN